MVCDLDSVKLLIFASSLFCDHLGMVNNENTDLKSVNGISIMLLLVVCSDNKN